MTLNRPTCYAIHIFQPSPVNAVSLAFLWLKPYQVSVGWAAYVKTQAHKLLKKMGVPSDTIIYPDIQKLVFYQHTWRAPTAQSADTAAVMVIILPLQLKVSLQGSPWGCPAMQMLVTQLDIAFCHNLFKLFLASITQLPCANAIDNWSMWFSQVQWHLATGNQPSCRHPKV